MWYHVSTMDIMNIGLPKWPGCIIVGNPISRDQAKEIIVRTNGYISTNDHQWNRAFKEAISDPDSREFISDDGNTDYERGRLERIDFDKRYGHIWLSYLNNNRIASCYIGGPNGWVDWDGTVSMRDKNIGKWPSVDEVFNDWKRIATAFPFLNLKCWLLDREITEEGATALVEFSVANGHASVGEVTTAWFREFISAKDDNAIQNAMMRIMMGSQHEHVTMDEAVKAYRFVEGLLESRQVQALGSSDIPTLPSVQKKLGA